MVRLNILVIAGLLAACGATPEPVPTAPPAPPPAKPVAAQSAAPKADAPPPAPVAPPSSKPVLPDFEVLVRSDMPEAFAAVQKNFKEKYFEQGLEALEAQREQAKRGQLADDHKMLTYAASGFAFAMQNNPAEAKANYRRILPMWGNWRSAVKTLERLEKDEAAGRKRVALALDCVGEALFYLAEIDKDKAAEVVMPSYDGDAEPRVMKRYLDTKVKAWIQARTGRIRKASKEYERVMTLLPNPPPRFVAAATSRIAAMHALVLEDLRTIKPHGDWKTEGKSAFTDPVKGKEPLDWKVIQDEFQASWSALADPVKASAKEAYGRCVSASAEHGSAKDDVFLKTCNDWLAGNK
jgi:tetratricopeptide (TPR) repeat protein